MPHPRSATLLLGTLAWSALCARGNQYRIDVQSDANLNLRGVVRLVWRNDTPVPATEIPLLAAGRVTRVTGADRPARFDGHRILLSDPVPPGAEATVHIEFQASALRSYGYRLLTGAWHPKAVTFRNGSYKPNQQQADDYDVTVTAPAALVLAAAGEETEPTADGGRRRWHWRLTNITGFGLAASPGFVETRRESGGVRIRLYQIRGDPRLDPAMADDAAAAVAFYRALFHFYPHPALVMLPGDSRNGGGYSPASGIAVFHRNTADHYGWIVAHEIAHQYWGFDTVIDDGDYYHWPGLALGIWSDQRYVAAAGGPRFGWPQYRDAVSRSYDTTIRRTTAEMSKLHFDWNNVIGHQKAFRVIRMLEDLMGEDRFLQFAQALLERFRYRCVSFDDFQAAAEEFAGRKLDWFFHDWVDTNGVASYAVDSVESAGGGIDVRIRRTGTARYPIEVRVTAADGARAVQRLAVEPDLQTLHFAVPAAAARVELDPAGKCPMRREIR
jgi:hypothetical protein